MSSLQLKNNKPLDLKKNIHFREVVVMYGSKKPQIVLEHYFHLLPSVYMALWRFTILYNEVPVLSLQSKVQNRVLQREMDQPLVKLGQCILCMHRHFLHFYTASVGSIREEKCWCFPLLLTRKLRAQFYASLVLRAIVKWPGQLKWCSGQLKWPPLYLVSPGKKLEIPLPHVKQQRPQ